MKINIIKNKTHKIERRLNEQQMQWDGCLTMWETITADGKGGKFMEIEEKGRERKRERRGGINVREKEREGLLKAH